MANAVLLWAGLWLQGSAVISEFRECRNGAESGLNTVRTLPVQVLLLFFLFLCILIQCSYTRSGGK